ncbi:MAG: hypothetical protein WC612_01310 [Bdellovibrionales bacterium]|jgi:hypothetical protein
MSFWHKTKDPSQGEGKKAGSLRKVGGHLFIVLMTLFFLSGVFWTPQSAFALTDGQEVESFVENAFTKLSTYQEISNWLEENKAWISITNGVTKMMNLFRDLMRNFRVEHGQATIKLLTAQQLQARTTIEATQAMLDAGVRNQVEGQEIKHLAEHVMPPAAEQFLCNLILARQAVPVMTEFARIISKTVAKGIDVRYRSKGSDGNGPQYAMDAWNIKCGKYGENRPKTGNAIDGVPEACRAPVTAPTIGYADGDVSIDTLSREKVYTVPPIKDVDLMINGKLETVKDFFPEEGNEAHKQWLMARQYCYNLAGPRLTPPRDEDLDRPAGKAKFVQFLSCLSRQSAFVKTCADRLGKLTRPDCSNDDFKEFCDASVQACDAAREAQIVLPPDFNNCKDGLSLYQAEYLSSVLCGSTRRIQADTHGGVQDPKKVSTLLMCQIMRESLKKQWQNEDKVFTRAQQGMQNMKGCWE